MKYAFIHAEGQHHTVNQRCSVLKVSTSGYYAWVDRPPSKTQKANQQLVTKIRCYHQASRRTYGLTLLPFNGHFQ
ncbi:MAG: hypothetical protein ACJ04O_09870 [Cellvibrionales bacterium]